MSAIVQWGLLCLSAIVLWALFRKCYCGEGVVMLRALLCLGPYCVGGIIVLEALVCRGCYCARVAVEPWLLLCQGLFGVRGTVISERYTVLRLRIYSANPQGG